MKQYKTKEEIMNRAKEAIGVPFGTIDYSGRLKTGKGGLGNMIEECWFDIKPNSRPEPDFADAGVELKVTPFLKKKTGYSAKERLVLNIINYMEEWSNTFETSSFWKKNKCLQMMFYENDIKKERKDWSIAETILFQFPEEDLCVIKDDWEIIVEFIRTGKAHELSEGLTKYLGACTKGTTSKKSLRKQKFSEIPAKQRAYSLKQSYMTYLLNSYVFGRKKDEKIIKDASILRETSFEDYIQAQIKPYVGRTQESLLREFNLNKSKGVNETIVSRILGIAGKVSRTEEFIKANIMVKTIRVKKNGTIEQSMSFPTFKFTELINQEWETSDLREMLEKTRFMFVIFQFNNKHELILKGLKFWNMPPFDIDHDLKIVWERTVNTINRGVKLIPTSRGITNDLPKQSENKVAHVRPHGRNSKDTYPLPDGTPMTKQCFWLNNTYVYEQIKEIIE